MCSDYAIIFNRLNHSRDLQQHLETIRKMSGKANEKFKKIDKEFCITDNSVNVYGYRCLTEGLLLDEVKKNPIGFLMHNREKGVVVRWEDFKTIEDKVFAKPVVNLSHPDGQSVADQIEGGFLNAASVGKIVVLEASSSEELKLQDQTGPTITKWFPREISLVDIPGNYNALASLYDKDNNELNLADFNTNFYQNMNKTVLTTAVILTALNLSDKSEESEVLKAIQDLMDKAEKVPGLEKELADKNSQLEELRKEGLKKEVEDLISKGKEDKKLTNEMAEKLSEKYASDPKGLKDLIDTMPAQVSVVETLNNNEDLGDLKGKTWDELFREGKLQELKEKHPDLYDKMKNEKFPNLKED